VYCSSCSRKTIKEHVRRYLADSIECQQHVSDFVIQQFSDAFLDECVDSVTVYDLSASLQVHDIYHCQYQSRSHYSVIVN